MNRERLMLNALLDAQEKIEVTEAKLSRTEVGVAELVGAIRTAAENHDVAWQADETVVALLARIITKLEASAHSVAVQLTVCQRSKAELEEHIGKLEVQIDALTEDNDVLHALREEKTREQSPMVHRRRRSRS